jgi:hypothetical protein
MDIRDQIAALIKTLGLDEQIALVRPYEYLAILERIIAERTLLNKNAVSALWWWESLRAPVAYAPSEAAEIADTLRMLAAPGAAVWFVVEADRKEHGNFWLYEGSIEAVCALLPEMPMCEFYVVSRKMDWLICENHHDMLIVNGDTMVEKAKRLPAFSRQKAGSQPSK